jgi:hypothetical protein
MKQKSSFPLLLFFLGGILLILCQLDHAKAQTWSVRTTITGTTDPNFPPPCVEIDCDCSDFKYQEDAQRLYDYSFFSNDPFGLDGIKGNSSLGVKAKACEHLPSRNLSNRSKKK